MIMSKYAGCAGKNSVRKYTGITYVMNVRGEMNRLKLWWQHFKIRNFGDQELQCRGKTIPCKRCGSMFKSYTHYGATVFGSCYVYNALCKKCMQGCKTDGREYIHEVDHED
jgi:hypothetical protein